MHLQIHSTPRSESIHVHAHATPSELRGVNVYMYTLLCGVDVHRHIHSTLRSECSFADSLYSKK